MNPYAPSTDAYIAKAPEYARPILEHLRDLIHRVCPDAKEAMKWGHVAFEYHGSIMCGLAAFKQYVSIGFWKEKLLNDPYGILNAETRTTWGALGRITCMEDLPKEEIIVDFIRQAMLLNETGAKVPKKAKPESAQMEPDIHPDFESALQKSESAMAQFQGFSPSKRKEYLEWILDAKSDATREKRISQAVEWISEGKSRHWKYERK